MKAESTKMPKIEGDGQFVLYSRNNRVPIRLEFEPGSDKSISIVANLEDEISQILCVFQDGQLFVRQIEHKVAQRLGLLTNDDGYLKVSRIGP